MSPLPPPITSQFSYWDFGELSEKEPIAIECQCHHPATLESCEHTGLYPLRWLSLEVEWLLKNLVITAGCMQLQSFRLRARGYSPVWLRVSRLWRRRVQRTEEKRMNEREQFAAGGEAILPRDLRVQKEINELQRISTWCADTNTRSSQWSVARIVEYNRRLWQLGFINWYESWVFSVANWVGGVAKTNFSIATLMPWTTNT